VKDPDRKRKLLIVDDEPVILQILEAVFEDGPWELSACSTGEQAREEMEKHGVDILLTDKNLPDINGLDLLVDAKRVNPLAEVIIITGYASLETALSALEMDAFDYVLKPLNNVFEIRKKVERAAAKQAIAEENQVLLVELASKNDALESALAETRTLQDELIQTEKLAGIGTLAAGIAHEVSSPLFGIMGLAEAIAEEEEVQTSQAYAREIVEYSKGIRDIVKELSSYSRAASNEYLTTVDLQQVIADAVRLVERSTDCKNVEIEQAVGSNLFVNARTNEIQQIFVNLVKNAVDSVAASDSQGRIRVMAHPGDGEVLLVVEDNGPGIPPENVKQVFDPFFTTKEPGKGTGLGLNIVYRIVTKYRGTIRVGPSELGGAAFQIRFPVQF
jgi:C4-dicarboxylate-specific signal transduction histidine kinase